MLILQTMENCGNLPTDINFNSLRKATKNETHPIQPIINQTTPNKTENKNIHKNDQSPSAVE